MIALSQRILLPGITVQGQVVRAESPESLEAYVRFVLTRGFDVWNRHGHPYNVRAHRTHRFGIWASLPTHCRCNACGTYIHGTGSTITLPKLKPGALLGTGAAAFSVGNSVPEMQVITPAVGSTCGRCGAQLCPLEEGCVVDFSFDETHGAVLSGRVKYWDSSTRTLFLDGESLKAGTRYGPTIRIGADPYLKRYAHLWHVSRDGAPLVEVNYGGNTDRRKGDISVWNTAEWNRYQTVVRYWCVSVWREIPASASPIDQLLQIIPDY